ncbi:MAG: transcription elongation factor GreA, partial [Planctomycetota bacterium]
MEILSPEEFENVKAKLKSLTDNRAKIAERIAEARELGDLKENAE